MSAVNPFAMRSIADLARDLAAGNTTSRALIEACYAAQQAPDGEGRRAFLSLDIDAARILADAVDALRKRGKISAPFAGIPIVIKDLFDVAGEVTAAGSRVLADRPPAEADAPAVARLRQAGFIPFGRSNMTEFAYSGLGMNPHYGTPKSPWDRASGRIPGGSTSGGAVAVADGMASAALGTDTGGSCRIPAAFCGITGFKPTAKRVPREGVIPLSTSFDSVGPLAPDVTSCAIIDSVLAGEAPCPPAAVSPADLKLAVPQSFVLEGLDEHVARAFAAAVRKLADAGARIVEIALAELLELPAINAKGGIINAEAYAWHRPLVETRADLYDPWVRSRFDVGMKMSAADYIETARLRAELIDRVAAATADFDALVFPTVAIVPPKIADLADPAVATKTNLQVLRNTHAVNFLDRCAVSLPCHEQGEAPVGLMLVGRHGDDRRLLAAALAAETALETRR